MDWQELKKDILLGGKVKIVGLSLVIVVHDIEIWIDPVLGLGAWIRKNDFNLGKVPFREALDLALKLRYVGRYV